MNWLVDLITNPFVIIGMSSWGIAQVLKMIIYAIINKEWSIHRLFGDGGMPSGHSATVVCMTVMVGYTCGMASPLFGVAFIIAIIVMHDATGVRRETGKQARLLIEVISTLNGIISERDAIVRRQKLKTMVGHTPMQVFFGALFGVLIAVIYILVFKIEYGAYISIA